MSLRLLCASFACTLSASAFAELHTFDQAGTLTVDTAAPRSASLHITCTPEADGGAISVELVVPEAYTRKDFDYDDFEGPDPSAGDKVLSEIAWTSSASSTSISSAAGGWYSPEPPESFHFGISQLSHRREAPAHLLAAIKEAGTLVWTQTAFNDAKRRLVATFAFDAATSRRLHDTVATCLPQVMPARKPGG
jgi:hypothetical protein